MIGLTNALLGSASTMSDKERDDFGSRVCAEGEPIELAFKTKRDSYVFTDRRFLIEDVRGMTGSKRSLLSIPYARINAFSIETGGFMNLDGDLFLWVTGFSEPVKREFRKSVDIYTLQALLASKIG